jgi:hypothetical protein
MCRTPGEFARIAHPLAIPPGDCRSYVDEIGAGHSSFLMRDESLAILNRHVRPMVG